MSEAAKNIDGITDHYFVALSEAAAAKGLVVVEPLPNQLFLDIDSAEDAAVFEKHRQVLESEIESFSRAPSPSGKPGREHITVTLKRDVVDAIERIALQATLGSDRFHEALSLRAAIAGSCCPTVFFEKPPC